MRNRKGNIDVKVEEESFCFFDKKKNEREREKFEKKANSAAGDSGRVCNCKKEFKREITMCLHNSRSYMQDVGP